MVKSFDSQSLSKLTVSDNDHNEPAKASDTQSLDPKGLMKMSAFEQKDSHPIQKPGYIETLISVSQIESSEIVCNSPYQDSEAIVNTQMPLLEQSVLGFDCTSPYLHDYPRAILKSNVISESKVNQEPILKDLKPDHNANYRSDAIQYSDTLMVPQAPIQLVPVYAIVKLPQNHLKSVASYPVSDSMNANGRGQTVERQCIPFRNDSFHGKKSINERENRTCSKSDNRKKSMDGPNLDNSLVTLYETASCEDILLENANSYKDTALNDSLLDSLGKESESNTSRGRGIKLSRKIFRILNLLRAIAVAIYAFVLTSKQLENSDAIGLGAKNLLITSLIFAGFDVIVAFIRLFPQYFWCFWDVKNWDPYSKTYTVWAVIANHDLLIDIFPVLLNMMVRIYMYRMSEILANPSIQDSIYNISISINQANDIFKYQNLIILMCFVATLVYTIAFHAASVMFYLSWDKKANTLGFLVFFKSLLLLFDVLTDGMLLYKVLVFKGIDLFDLHGLLGFTISIVAPSPIITLVTNGLVNIPLHYFNFRMRLGSRMIGPLRILKASCTQTFHTLLIPFFLYLFYSSSTLVYILKEIRLINTAVENLVPQNSFFGWTSGSDILLGMIWTNVVLNYLGGMLVCILWIILGHFWTR